ncbi:hypothetical protein PRK78_000545 [Emydomyces testavorans]|uniref:Uncharacterized protein n=1 Tax=Emydomyces testavorans TaxID=2070801 RepID=A0AAF0DCP8_9EURO|nr:hypothetical protein PRK78_000545 [Emydomyces testavorans]
MAPGQPEGDISLNYSIPKKGFPDLVHLFHVDIDDGAPLDCRFLVLRSGLVVEDLMSSMSALVAVIILVFLSNLDRA